MTSVRQSGHDVWFHSHLSTQHALRGWKRRSSKLRLAFVEEKFINVVEKIRNVLEEMLARKRYDVITNTITKLANRAFLVGFVSCTQCQRELVSNLNRQSPEKQTPEEINYNCGINNISYT